MSGNTPPEFQAQTTGKEQLILLPIPGDTIQLHTDDSVVLQIDTGMHTVVFSGIAGFDPSVTIETPRAVQRGGIVREAGDDDPMGVADDFSPPESVSMIVGPGWREVVQVSASVSPSGIFSGDSDEVDHSDWDIAECTWSTVNTSEGDRIRLFFETSVRGLENGWISFAYHVVATGTLARMPSPDEISADI